ncbi:hypothetical protein BUALT_Bualt17G0050200 [Buddleja alternifolia]|uniref:EamA domain-containing protein n=1 Tax=Buddleja alternifolia TaxID=168488 RepID=A0AAV6WEN3_9LAMI|nr:hypothetical protein BUALT_Bualt17G0050200 [Buddleja alternifolia]
MASTAMARGMSPFVFVVYTNALGSIILLPYAFFNNRDRSAGSFLTFPFFVRVFVLGLIGITIAQNLAFVGLSYSSPIVACGMANQMPALSFVLGIILRTTKFDWRRSGSQARLIGTFIALMGAISLTLYKGPTVKDHPSPTLAFPAATVVASPPRLLVFTSPHQNWILGCILFAASSFTLAIWNVVQVGTVKMCPQVMKIISFYSLFGTIQSAMLAAYLERDHSAWRLELNFELLIIILTAIFSSLIRSNIQIWCTRLKGPYFVPIFKPFGIPYASTFGCVLFADTFHYGRSCSIFQVGDIEYKEDELEKLFMEDEERLLKLWEFKVDVIDAFATISELVGNKHYLWVPKCEYKEDGLEKLFMEDEEPLLKLWEFKVDVVDIIDVFATISDFVGYTRYLRVPKRKYGQNTLVDILFLSATTLVFKKLKMVIGAIYVTKGDDVLITSCPFSLAGYVYLKLNKVVFNVRRQLEGEIDRASFFKWGDIEYKDDELEKLFKEDKEWRQIFYEYYKMYFSEKYDELCDMIVAHGMDPEQLFKVDVIDAFATISELVGNKHYLWVPKSEYEQKTLVDILFLSATTLVFKKLFKVDVIDFFATILDLVGDKCYLWVPKREYGQKTLVDILVLSATILVFKKQGDIEYKEDELEKLFMEDEEPLLKRWEVKKFDQEPSAYDHTTKMQMMPHMLSLKRQLFNDYYKIYYPEKCDELRDMIVAHEIDLEQSIYLFKVDVIDVFATMSDLVGDKHYLWVPKRKYGQKTLVDILFLSATTLVFKKLLVHCQVQPLYQLVPDPGVYPLHEHFRQLGVHPPYQPPTHPEVYPPYQPATYPGVHPPNVHVQGAESYPSGLHANTYAGVGVLVSLPVYFSPNSRALL